MQSGSVLPNRSEADAGMCDVCRIILLALPGHYYDLTPTLVPLRSGTTPMILHPSSIRRGSDPGDELEGVCNLFYSPL